MTHTIFWFDLICRLAQVVKITVSLGMWLTFPLQFFIAIQIIWPHIDQKFGPYKSPAYELMFRTFMVLLTCTLQLFGLWKGTPANILISFTVAIAELVPRLNLFISLIGALCSTGIRSFLCGSKSHKNLFIIFHSVVVSISANYSINHHLGNTRWKTTYFC